MWSGWTAVGRMERSAGAENGTFPGKATCCGCGAVGATSAACAWDGYALEADIGARLVVEGIMHADANIARGDGRLFRNRAGTLGILLIAVIGVEVPKYLAILYVSQGMALRCALLSC